MILLLVPILFYVRCLSNDAEGSADMLLWAWQVGLKGQPSVLEGKFSKPVQPDECLWSLDNGSIEMTLQKADRMTWWSSIVEGEPAIDTSKVSTTSPADSSFSRSIPNKSSGLEALHD